MAKIILTNEVNGLGAAGDVVEVKNGYARNYLFPQGYAVAWTRGGQKQVEQIKVAREVRSLKTAEEANVIKAKLAESKVRLEVKTGSGGRLFGSVKQSDIANAVASAGIAEIDKRKIEIPAPIKVVGNYIASVKLLDNLTAEINLQVVSAKKKK